MRGRKRAVRGGEWARELLTALEGPPKHISQWLPHHARLLKQDMYSQVGLLTLGGRCCYLKLYSPKSFLQQCIYELGQGRPSRAFDNASRLVAAGVPVPRPLACVNLDSGVMLLTEGLEDGVDMQTLWLSGPGAATLAALHSAADALSKLHLAGYAHGDAKWSNLLWANDRMLLIDLDGARRCRIGGRRQARDLARFTLNAEERGVGSQLYKHFLDRYLGAVGGDREQVIRRMQPSLLKLRARHLARYGEGEHNLLA
tara:strand:+ start:252167 stop:252937 length:771 start_codon:yes stop_codon:yes gene_type:complete